MRIETEFNVGDVVYAKDPLASSTCEKIVKGEVLTIVARIGGEYNTGVIYTLKLYSGIYTQAREYQVAKNRDDLMDKLEDHEEL